jgi:hypothetical protein
MWDITRNVDIGSQTATRLIMAFSKLGLAPPAQNGTGHNGRGGVKRPQSSVCGLPDAGVFGTPTRV